MELRTKLRRLGMWPLLALVALLVAAPAIAQTTTATIRGVVKSDSGLIAGANVAAVSTESGFGFQSKSGADGSFVLAGLKPGSYEIRVSAPSFSPAAKTVEVLLGQTLTVEFRVTPESLFVEDVTVVGERLLDTRNSEIGTNVTKEQIESLPQSSRNFLNFAALAPGIRTTDDENATKKFSSGALNSREVNVFIDGLSYKNDVLQGGAFMQDSSRGNPFPQNAVQEFKVITQNYKAEYEKAAAAVITAVTKSGGNEWSGDVFVSYQNENLVSQDFFSKQRGDEEKNYKRLQAGFGVGGPLIKDKLHLFVSYEQNDQDRYNAVFFGNATIPDNLQPKFDAYQSQTGLVLSPFTSKLFFGKLTWQPAANQTLEFSANFRDEDERRGFGGQRVYEGAEQFKIKNSAAVGKWQVAGDKWVNEAYLNFQRMEWNPTALFPEIPHQNYFGILDIGGKDSTQDFKQDRIGLREDFTYTASWRGQHTIKTGAILNFMKYDVKKRLDENPVFNFRSDENWQFPFEAFYGSGDPGLDFSNNQFGVYIQDDWRITPKFELNAGIRWDYESNMINNDHVTPANVVDALANASSSVNLDGSPGPTTFLRDVLDLNRYTTDGNRRDPYMKMFQPRLGGSYDINGDGRAVVFASIGRYYDRVNLNDIFDESFRLTWQIRRFCFTDPAAPAQPPCIPWQDSYLSREGLQGLIESGVAPGPELFLVDNELKPPRSDQATIGFRKGLGDWIVSTSYNKVRGYNGLAWFLGDLKPGATERFNANQYYAVPGFGRTFIATDRREQWYDAVYFTLDRPYGAGSRWGLNIAYTWANAEQYGTSNFSEGVDFSAFDYNTPDDYTRVPSDFDERQRFVMTGIFGLPWDVKLSGILTLGSGVPYTIFDASGPQFRIRWNEGQPVRKTFILGKWAYRSIDLRAEKTFKLPAHQSIAVQLEGFNVLNFTNFDCYEQFLPAGNPGRFGQPNCAINPRRLQVGLKYGF